jgi:hypothetical protein
MTTEATKWGNTYKRLDTYTRGARTGRQEKNGEDFLFLSQDNSIQLEVLPE